MRAWKIRIETEGPDSESIFVDSQGRRDDDARFVGTNHEAAQEAERRCCLWETKTGETASYVEYVLCGVGANNT